MIVSENITKDGLSKSKAYPCWICSLREKVIFCMHNVVSGCAGEMRAIQKYSSRKFEGNMRKETE